MVRHVPAICVAVLIGVGLAHAAPPARIAFMNATEQEQEARAALSDPAATADALKKIRKAVSSYEAIVRQHPTSSYSDDALWRGGTLALDAFTKFGDARDRDAGLRLLRLLASDYPASKLAKRVPLFLEKQQSSGVTTAAGTRTEPAGVTMPARRPNASSAPPVVEAAPSTRTPAGVTPQQSSAPIGRSMPVPAPPDAARTQPEARPARSVAAVPAAAQASKPATITSIRRAVLTDVVRIVIAIDSEVPFHDERIDGPARIFVDLPATRAAASLIDRTLRFDGDADLVRQVRLGRHPNTTTRVVLEAEGVSSYSVYPLYAPYRLVIDCTRPASAATAAAVVRAAAPLVARPIRVRTQTLVAGVKPPVIERFVEPVSPLASRRLGPIWGRRVPAVNPLSSELLYAATLPPLAARALPLGTGTLAPVPTSLATSAIADALKTPAARPSATIASSTSSSPAPSTLAGSAGDSTPSTSTSAPSTSASSASSSSTASASSSPTSPSSSSTKAPLSMARQLGLGVSRIVIDPGHGGHDPGAKGKAGVAEAELVLDVSQRLQKLLQKVPGVEVILTREDDQFVALPERTDRANREGADLFLSIHANASANDQAHGVETYFLNFATNLGAAAVAARENAASGQAMAALPDFVKAIALNNKLDESRDFAGIVQESVVDHLRQTNKTVKNLGVKQAPFVVLIGASMPSVLVEISFVTNPQEARLLKGGGYRQKIAEALFDAVRTYQTSLNNVRSVANAPATSPQPR